MVLEKNPSNNKILNNIQKVLNNDNIPQLLSPHSSEYDNNNRGISQYNSGRKTSVPENYDNFNKSSGSNHEMVKLENYEQSFVEDSDQQS